MLKQLTIPATGSILGFALLVTAAAPAAADRGKAYWVDPAPRYVYETQPAKQSTTTYPQQKSKAKFQNNLDFETEAVWRNLRPNLFD